MKIGIVCYPTYGGSGVMATELGLALADKGHEIHFITYTQPVRLHEFRPNIYFHEVRIPDYPLFEFPPYESALAGTMVDVIQNNHLDLLHVHYAIPHASSACLANQMLKNQGIRVPYITTLHGTDITLVGKERQYKPVVTFSINESDAVTAVSESLKKETIHSFEITKDIHVIHNFVDHKRFHNVTKQHFKELIAPSGERILVHVSNFRKVKRVEDVIKMFHLVHQKIPSKLIMIGDGPERSIAEDLTRSLSITSNVRFMGKQERMEEIFNIADLFVLPSQYESFGLAALEAMSCGLPVISSNAGGIPEVNINGLTGYTSNVGDYKEMANNALKIISDEDVLNKFKKAAEEKSKEFSIDIILPQYENLYKKTLQEAQKRYISHH